MQLWNKKQELTFFNISKNMVLPEQLFNKTEDDRYLAYWPKKYGGKKSTSQSRNSLIGNFTENWVASLLNNIIPGDLYVIQQAQIPSIGISKKSPADVVIATKNKKILKAKDVKIIFEVKMSIVWNWEYDFKANYLKEIGDYRTHKGKPSFTRSGSLLKAIGKCIDIRVSNWKASKIPLIILGNAPLSNGFCKKSRLFKKCRNNSGILVFKSFSIKSWKYEKKI